MIHQLLTLSRPLFVFDTETTGLNTETARIIELGFQEWTAEGMVKEYRTLINPGVPIPAAATAIHHITDAMVQGCRVCGLPAKEHEACAAVGVMGVHAGEREDGMCTECGSPNHEFKPWPTFRQLAPNLAIGFKDCDYAGKNIRFDLRIQAAEMKRSGQPWSYSGARIIDADRLEQIAVPRHLSDLHKKYAGAEHEGAHGALSDVRASVTVIAGQLETYDALPRDLAALHELSWPGWLTVDGGFRMVDGVPTIMFGKHKGKAMSDADVNRPDRRGQTYWDWMLSADFSDEVKKLAAEAKMGKFPSA